MTPNQQRNFNTIILIMAIVIGTVAISMNSHKCEDKVTLEQMEEALYKHLTKDNNEKLFRTEEETATYPFNKNSN